MTASAVARLPTRHRPGNTLAEHARRILGCEHVVVTSVGSGPLAQRVVADAGSATVRGADAELLEKHERLLADQGRGRPDVHSPQARDAVDRGTWWSSPVRDGDGLVDGTLHVLAMADWSADAHTRRTLDLFAPRFARFVMRESEHRLPDDDMVELAREMSELGLSAESYADLTAGLTVALAPLFDATKTGIGLWHGDSHYLQLLPGSFGSDAVMAASSQIRGSDPRSGAARVRMTGQPYYTNDLEAAMPRYAAWLKLMGVHRLMTLPIPIAGRIGGVLHIANKRTPFVDADMERAAEVVPYVAGAMEHVRHRIEARRNEALAAVVSRAGTAIAQGEPLRRFRASVLDEFCSTIGARMLAISFTNEAEPIVVPNGITDTAVEEAFLATSAAGGTALRTATRRPRAALDIGWSALHAPVIIGGQLEATFSLLRVPCEGFSKDEMSAIRRMANLTALAWATQRFHEERLEAARMRERQRIADDLHDDVAQVLFSGQLSVESILEQLGENTPLIQEAARARDLLVRSQNSIRDVIHQLSSPAPGLIPGLAALADSVSLEFGIRIDLTADRESAQVEPLVPPATAEIVLRATREAAINAAKHGGSGCDVWIRLRMNRRRLLVVVDDNGPGMPRKRRAEGYGLRAMRRNLREHHGTLRISTSPRGGTRYLISLPRPDAGWRDD